MVCLLAAYAICSLVGILRTGRRSSWYVVTLAPDFQLVAHAVNNKIRERFQEELLYKMDRSL